MNEKCQTLGSHRGAKMELKSIKNLIKNRMNFESDFETTFSRSWAEVGCQKPLRNERSEGHFFDIVAKMRKV